MNKGLININNWFEKLGKIIVKFRLFIIIFLVILFIFSLIGLPKIKLDNSIEGWFLDKAQIAIDKKQFEKTFGNSDYVALLIEANDVFSPKILKLLRNLGDDLKNEVPYADKVISLSDIEFGSAYDDYISFDNLVPDDIPENPDEIEVIRKKAFSKKNFVNKIFSDDCRQTWLLLRLYPFPDNWEKRAEEVQGISKQIINEYFKNPDKDIDYIIQALIEELNEKLAKKDIYLNYENFSNYKELMQNDYKIIKKIPIFNTFINEKTYLKNKKNLFKKIKKLINNEIQKQTDSPNNRVGIKTLQIINKEKYKDPDYSIKASGMPIFAYEDLQFGAKESSILTLIAIIVSIIILVIFLRSVRGIIIPLITTICSITFVFGIMGHLGIKLNATIMSVPVFLGFAVSIGYSIHIFNLWKREFIKNGDRKKAVYYTIKETGWPIFFTALTTIGSLISFSFISLVPLRWLGLTSAAIIFSVYLTVMLLTPALLSYGKNKIKTDAEKKDKFWSDKYFNLFGEWVLKHSKAIIIIYAIISVVFTIGMFKTEVNLNTKKTYGMRVPYINRLNYIAKTKIGSFLSYDLTIKFNKQDSIKDPEILKKFEVFTESVKSLKNTKKISSLLDIIKDMNQLFHVNKNEYYKIPDDKLMISQLLLLYESSGGSEAEEWVDNDYTTLRLMVEMEEMDTKEIINDLDYLKKKGKKIFPDAKITITGSMPEFAALNQYISAGQIKSFLIALCVIMILMMIVFKSIKIGLIGMIPNITPAIIVGGIMGFLRIPIDFVTVTMVPMILGLAVDDTIHFISHVRLEYLKTGEYKESILKTFRIVGKALFMTSFIIIGAFSVYFTSRINMFINMAIFLSAGIGSALISDYLVTPILIKWTKPFN